MENASKALLIAAVVLVVIIIIAFGIKIFSSSSEAQKEGIKIGDTINDKTKEATEFAEGEITGNRIQYYNGNTENKKNKKEVKEGDTLRIGTEKFLVFSVSNEGIKAMPFYNLVKVIESGEIKQGPESSGKSTKIKSTFSNTKYWDSSSGEISMDNSENNIQSYILAYKRTLNNMGAKNIDVKVARFNELQAKWKTLKQIGRNDGTFWLCTKGGGNKVFYANIR